MVKDKIAILQQSWRSVETVDRRTDMTNFLGAYPYKEYRAPPILRSSVLPFYTYLLSRGGGLLVRHHTTIKQIN